MAVLLPTVGAFSKLMEPAKNPFLLTKEEELEKVVKRAAKSSLDRNHALARYDPHNMALRAAAGDREEAKVFFL